MTAQVQEPLNIGVLISGSGSNLQSLIDHIEEGTLSAKISLVVSSRPDAYGIERAKKAGIPVLVMNREAYADTSAANQRIADALKELALNMWLWPVTCVWLPRKSSTLSPIGW